MRVLLIGGSGTIGRRLRYALADDHEVLAAGRTSGDVSVDLASADSIERMYRALPPLDAVVAVAASGPLDDFATLTEAQLHENMKGKLYGQVNLVLIGQHHLAPGGSFTLTSGVFADEAWEGVTSGAVINGALHSFVLSAALELRERCRINVVSPALVADSVDAYGDAFPGLSVVSMEELTGHYVELVEGAMTGQVVRAYGTAPPRA
jgi:NAD(P)-dependent dehydrogenase (short-subunit alcohol dehydrogenase family)